MTKKLILRLIVSALILVLTSALIYSLTSYNNLKIRYSSLETTHKELIITNDNLNKNIISLNDLTTKLLTENILLNNGDLNNSFFENQKMKDARKYLTDKGIKLDSSKGAEQFGTNLNSGIPEIEDQTVYVFLIENYDPAENHIWFYYSPKHNVAYKFTISEWSKV